MLRAGGNAVDAAVATSFALSVVRPYSCGIGGGGFMVIHFAATESAPVRTVALNYREMAPGAMGPDFYEKLDDRLASQFGAKAVGVPGTVAGLLHALETYGTMDRAAALAPAIRAAEEGFEADEHYVTGAVEVIKDFERDPAFKSRFGFVWSRFLREGRLAVGDRIRLPEQAEALRLIARDGAAAFYEGPIAEAMLEAVSRDGGVMTREDLGAFRVGTTGPLSFTFAGRTFLTMPPPSSGGITMGQILGIFEQAHTPHANPLFGVSPPTYLHVLVESMKHAFADRAEWLGDPAFVEIPVERLLSREYLRERADLIRLTRTRTLEEYGTRAAGTAPPRDDSGTSHFSVVDRWGNAVACTETINLEFGSLLAVDRYGFCLNNEMDDFTTVRGRANAFGLRQSDRNLPAPGKRPLSSMTPTIVLGEDGRVELVVGGSGGPRIISAVVQVVLGALLSPFDAHGVVEQARIHHQWQPDAVWAEREYSYELFGRQTSDRFDEYIRQAIGPYGHTVEARSEIANVQLIMRDRGGEGWQAACDPRKGGKPAGR